MKLTFDINYMDGQSEQVTAHPRSIVAFERTHKAKITGDSLGMTELMWIAWHASGANGTFDEWLDRVDELEPVDDEGGAPFAAPETQQKRMKRR